MNALGTPPIAPYGYCPRCGQPGVFRARRRNGNDRCAQGHMYPSAKARPEPVWSPAVEPEPFFGLKERLEGLAQNAQTLSQNLAALLDAMENAQGA